MITSLILREFLRMFWTPFREVCWMHSRKFSAFSVILYIHSIFNIYKCVNFREFRRFFERNFPLDLLNLRLGSHDAECLVLTNCYACNYIFCTRIFCHCDWIKSDSQAYYAVSWKKSIHQNFNHVSLIDHDHTDEHATQPISCDNFSFVQRHCHRHFSKENTTKQEKDASDFSACIRFFLIRLVIFGKTKIYLLWSTEVVSFRI